MGKTEEFKQFGKDLIDLAIHFKPKSLEELTALKLESITVAEKLNELLGKTGEKIKIAHYEFIEAPFVTAYNHQGNRLATVIGLSKKIQRILERSAMNLPCR